MMVMGDEGGGGGRSVKLPFIDDTEGSFCKS
jgi:hypothetical protein